MDDATDDPIEDNLPGGVIDDDAAWEEDGEEKVPMRKVMMLVGYVGRKYGGMQRTAEHETIEGLLLRSLDGFDVKSWSKASRTDKGVSAARQVCACKVKLRCRVEEIAATMNAKLPEDIRVFAVQRACKNLVCHKACDRRAYVYLCPRMVFVDDETFRRALEKTGLAERLSQLRNRLHDAPVPDWRLTDIEEELLERELLSAKFEDIVPRLRRFLRDAFLGSHRYHNFTKKTKPETARKILDIDVIEDQGWLRFTIVGRSFLLHQIRKMIAVSIEASRRGLDAGILTRLFDPNVHAPLQTAPGIGLFLLEPFFDAYNAKLGSHEAAVTFSSDDVDAFQRIHIEADIRTQHRSFVTEYLWRVAVFGFPIVPSDPPYTRRSSL